jgi:hypothetical protein
MKKRIILLSVFALLLLSCKDKVKKFYYGTGELSTEVFSLKNNDSLVYIKHYFKNGILEMEGYEKANYNSIQVDEKQQIKMDGHWKIYYSDGQFRWEGEIKNNVIQGDYKWNWGKYIEDYYQGIQIKGNPQELIAGNHYKFRIVMPAIHPQFYSVVDENFNLLDNLDNPDEYPYVFNFSKSGIFPFYIIFMDSTGNFSSRNPRLDCEVIVKEGV